jgi:hypothetical protein
VLGGAEPGGVVLGGVVLGGVVLARVNHCLIQGSHLGQPPSSAKRMVVLFASSCRRTRALVKTNVRFIF